MKEKRDSARRLPDLSVACIQTPLSWEDPPGNRARFDALFDQLQQRPDLIILPETFNTGFPVNPRIWAETPEGESYRWLRRKARETGAVICTSLLVKSEGGYFNRLVWMGPNGRHRFYDKRHVFHMGGEHHTITPGTTRLTVRLKGWSICPLVCYDLRFPAWCRNTYANGRFGYDLQLFVANWPAVRSGVWRQLLPARAIENQAYVLGVNRTGRDGHGMTYAGGTRVLDFKGQLLARAGTRGTALVETLLSGEALVRFRRKFNVGLDWDRFEITAP